MNALHLCGCCLLLLFVRSSPWRLYWQLFCIVWQFGFGALTTFCRNRSNLSHFKRVTSCRRLSICRPASGGTLPIMTPEPTTPSKHSEHDLVVVSADDIDSRPVSLSTYVAPPSIRGNALKYELHAMERMCTVSGRVLLMWLDKNRQYTNNSATLHCTHTGTVGRARRRRLVDSQ